jgi:hypothetical protein
MVLQSYVNTGATVPPSGTIYNDTSAPTILRLNAIDFTGKNHTNYLLQIAPGDTITIGLQVATINLIVNDGPNSWRITVDAWPALVDSTYAVTITQV